MIRPISGICKALACLTLLLFSNASWQPAQAQVHKDGLRWEALAPLPDSIGFAGVFAGISHDALLVGGGANFPTGSNFEGHPKVWHDRVFVLPSPDAEWQTGFELPAPLAYGVSFSWDKYLVCVGGGDQDAHSA